MSLICIHDRILLRKILEKDPYLNIYGLGDIDERFWPYTTWYGLEDCDRIKAVVCVYLGSDIPTALALSNETESMNETCKAMLDVLPCRFYAHLTPGLEEIFKKEYCIENRKLHHKMALIKPELLESEDFSEAHRLGEEDIPDLLELYNDSYPGNWFEPAMLSLNRYYGIKDGSRLLSAAGTHVYSPSLKAAAIGNIATRPECRGKGYGARVTAALSRHLLDEGIRIGLNVSVENTAAIACYSKIGFSINAQYYEYTMRRNAVN